MDFGFTDEQQQFADALRRYLGEQYGFDARQAIVRSDAGVSDVQWSAFAELGLTALPVPDAHGGFGGGPVDMLVAMQELGRALVVEPYWATAVGIEALRVAGSGTGTMRLCWKRSLRGRSAWPWRSTNRGRAMTCTKSIRVRARTAAHIG